MNNQLFVKHEDLDLMLKALGFDRTLDVIYKLAFISQSNPFISTKLIDFLLEAINEKKTQNS